MDTTDGALAMPPQRARLERVQLNTRVRIEIEQTLQQFVLDHNTTVQSSVDLALAEFLAARGYPLSAAAQVSAAQVLAAGHVSVTGQVSVTEQGRIR